MENGKKQPNRGALVLAGIGTVFVAACAAIALFFALRPETVVSLEPYVSVGFAASGEPIAKLDAEALLHDLRLPSPEDDPRAAERYPDVNALLGIRLRLTETDDPDTMRVTVLADADTLSAYGYRIEPLSWDQSVKGRVVTEASARPTFSPRSASFSPAPTPEAASPEPYFSPTPEIGEPFPTEHAYEPEPDEPRGKLLTSLLHADGSGYNLRTVCKEVQKRRDDFCPAELLPEGYTQKVEKIAVLFFVSEAGWDNLYRACYRRTIECEPKEYSEVSYFSVTAYNLRLDENGRVVPDGYYIDSYKSEAAMKREPSGYVAVTLSGGGVRVRGKEAFDQNGFVIFPGEPTSYRMANGLYWSPTYDLLDEDTIWKLTAVDGHSLANLLRYARKEIYARYYASFDPRSEREFDEHYRAYPWYVPLSPDRTVDITEAEWANIRLLREIQSLVEK